MMLNILKFYYLKSSVSDDTARLINNLLISANNYPCAWKILMDEYEDKQSVLSISRQIIGSYSCIHYIAKI